MGPRSSLYVRNVNSVLRRNRRILEELLPEGEEWVRISKVQLLERSFNFNHFTGAYVNKEGMVYYFCYEYGYLLMEDDWYCVSRRSEGAIKNPG
ncbi:MAG TPA: hypothetical protein VD996_13330 [Chitinophagaceae bacterium]|nr:hypothetical protein [Chitinophagaceae bacterium]